MALSELINLLSGVIQGSSTIDPDAGDAVLGCKVLT